MYQNGIHLPHWKVKITTKYLLKGEIMKSKDTNCFFCKSECEVDRIAGPFNVNRYECAYCGIYVLDEDSLLYPPDINIEDESVKFKIACVLNEKRLKGLDRIALSDKTDKDAKVCGLPQISVNDLLKEFPKKASDVFKRALLNLSHLCKHFDIVKLDLNSSDKLYFFKLSIEECRVFLCDLADQRLIRFNEVEADLQLYSFSPTAKFWDTIENL